MVQVSKYGDKLVIEYFTDEQWRLLVGNELRPGEEAAHRRMVQDRYRAFLEIRDVYEGQEDPTRTGETLLPAGGRRINPV